MNTKILNTKTYYDLNAEEWLQDKYTPEYRTDFHLCEIEKLTTLIGDHKANVLEIGVGDGRDAGEFVDKDIDYTGVDISHAIISLATENTPKGTFIQGDVLSLPLADNVFKGVYSVATLHHLPKEVIAEALSEIGRVLIKRSPGFITLPKGRGEETSTDGTHISYFTKPEAQKLLEENGFEVVELYEKKDPRENKPNWYFLFIRNNN